ncbi:hypothetical protein [Micromonospora chokoriensis]
MAEETGVDPEVAQRWFKRLQAVANDLEVALDNVVEVRARIFEPWSDDQYGRNFEKQFGQLAEDTLDQVKNIVASLGDLSGTGASTVGGFVDRDIENGSVVDNVGQSSGSPRH